MRNFKIFLTLFFIFMGKYVYSSTDDLHPTDQFDKRTLPSIRTVEPMTQGCCSWHGGVAGCSGGRSLCADGTLSPSCTCSSPPTPPPQPSYYAQLSFKKIGNGNGTVTSNPTGIGCGTDCSSTEAIFVRETMVYLAATPDENSLFTGWSGACLGTDQCAVIMNINSFVYANFESKNPVPSVTKSALSIEKNGNGSGVITSDPPGIECGSYCSGTAASFEKNSTVVLTASPNSNSTFSSWGGDCSGSGSCTIKMTSNKTATAVFDLVKITPSPPSTQTYTLFVDKAGDGNGTVTSAPLGVDCGSACTIELEKNTIITLTASPTPGSSFGGWSGSCTGTGQCSVKFDTTRKTTATFNSTRLTKNTTIGVFKDGLWQFDANQNGYWDGCQQSGGKDLCIKFGKKGTLPLIGNWGGGDQQLLGFFNLATGIFYLDSNNDNRWSGCKGDRCYRLDKKQNTAVIGDWQGSGFSKIGLYNDGVWSLDANGNGQWDGCQQDGGQDLCFNFGDENDLPIIGDWNGTNQTKIGVFRPGLWRLDVNGNGQWDGCQQDGGQDLCFNNQFGQAGDIPIIGDWKNIGHASIGVFRQGLWLLDANGNGQWDGCQNEGGQDLCLNFGDKNAMPVVRK